MLDIKFVRNNPEVVKQNIKNKFQDDKLPLVDEVIELDQRNREIKQEVEALRADKNQISKQIGACMAQGKKEEAEELKKKVQENAERVEALSKEEKDEITSKYLKKFKLEGFENRYPWQLSGGQQQRIALARALCLNPDILILDEPFSALDYHLRSNMENELCEILKDFDGNVLFVTHDISEAYRISDDIIVFDNGLSLPKRTKNELFVHPSCMTEAVITGCKNISSCDIINTDTVFAKDWGFNCKIEKGVNENSKHIGIRAHHMKVVEEEVENGENLFEMTVVRVIENSFSYNIHIKNCDNENNLPLQMEVDKNIKKVKVGQTIKVKFEQNSVFDF